MFNLWLNLLGLRASISRVGHCFLNEFNRFNNGTYFGDYFKD